MTAPRDGALFVRCLPLLLPQNSIIYLENTSFALTVDEELLPRSVPGALKIALGTIWPQPEYLHIPATRENLEAIAQLFESHAAPEICDHLHAYHDGEVILQWHDAFARDPLYVSTDIAEETIRKLCTACGCEYVLSEI